MACSRSGVDETKDGVCMIGAKRDEDGWSEEMSKKEVEIGFTSWTQMNVKN